MANLDRFSQPLSGETYFEDEKPVCQCEECGEDLFDGEWHFKTEDGWFCDKSCFIEWCLIEFDAKSEILEGEN